MRLGEVKKITCSDLTAETLTQLVALVRAQRTEPIVRRAAENIIAHIPEKNWRAEIEAITDFVKKSIRYTRDIQDVEYVKTPVRHLIELRDYGISYGDCDDMSTLLATLLNAVGYKCRFVIIRTQGNPQNAYNHIYVEVFEPGSKQWLTLDATMKSKAWDWSPQYLMRKDFMI